jgi:hypothetical protein
MLNNIGGAGCQTQILLIIRVNTGNEDNDTSKLCGVQQYSLDEAMQSVCGN